MVAYTGAGLLGVAGIVEWPIALTGAAVVWLTQPKPGGSEETDDRKATAGSSSRRSALQQHYVGHGPSYDIQPRRKVVHGHPQDVRRHP